MDIDWDSKREREYQNIGIYVENGIRLLNDIAPRPWWLPKWICLNTWNKHINLEEINLKGREISFLEELSKAGIRVPREHLDKGYIYAFTLPGGLFRGNIDDKTRVHAMIAFKKKIVQTWIEKLSE